MYIVTVVQDYEISDREFVDEIVTGNGSIFDYSDCETSITIEHVIEDDYSKPASKTKGKGNK